MLLAPASRSISTKKFTCPMHPEAQTEKPGSCPKCGMALEPVDISLAPEHTEYACPMHPEM
jgi:P-type Cu+ transporter